jgi:hypothetical protein
VDSIDELRSEIQRVAESCADMLRPEFQSLHRKLDDIATTLQHSNRKKVRRRPDTRKEAITKLIQNNPEISNLQICFALDKLHEKSAEYAPPSSWPYRLWCESYRKANNRVHAYMNSIRRSLA